MNVFYKVCYGVYKLAFDVWLWGWRGGSSREPRTHMVTHNCTKLQLQGTQHPFPASSSTRHTYGGTQTET